MADCYAPEMDDLHRRWLPREIFADIGIADVAPGSAAAAEDFAVHLTAGIFGGQAAALRPTPPPPPPPPAPYHQQHQAAQQVCGFEGSVLVAYGGGCVNGGGAPAAWPLSPYSPLQWQVGTNFANGGGVPGGPMVPAPPLGPYYGPPPAKRRLGGTGVFLPRAEVYQYQHKAAAATKPPAKDGKAPKEERYEKKMQQQRGYGQKDQQWQKVAETPTPTQTPTPTTKEQQQEMSASAALLALPQEWTY